jgi:hypothetical protein
MIHKFKNKIYVIYLLQQFATPHALRDEIIDLAVRNGLDNDCYVKMLDHTINLFESQGLGTEYYGYHNINHELEVTYITLLSASWSDPQNDITTDELKHLYVSALFHDFDPKKSVDKPHEDNVIHFISIDKKLQDLLTMANIDLEIIKILILRTTYPWSGQLKQAAEEKIQQAFDKAGIASKEKQDRIMKLGWFLSIADRAGGYSLGDFTKGMEMAKMNAHALAWHPSLIAQRAVAYFEELLNNESIMLQRVLRSLPKHMRKNFIDNVQSFFALRQEEIKIQTEHIYENLKLVPVIEKMNTRNDSDFIKTLFDIYNQLPRPLQFGRDQFAESVKDPNIILNTLRRDSPDGEIIGYAKGGPLENYQLRPEINDQNYGLNNTVFLEPFPLKMGYWGLHGGKELRHLFAMQAHAKKYKYLTSFALRDVIKKRINSKEKAESVASFDPERWDYYRIMI